MRNLTLNDVRLGLDDLLSKRKAVLMTTAVGQMYASLLADKKKALDALPASLVGEGAPLAEDLLTADKLHDGFGMGIYHVTRAYEEAPEVPAPVKAAAQRVRQGLVPRLAELRRSYPDEAAAAVERRKALASLEPDLKLIPLAGEKTLFDWAGAYVSQGERLNELLSARSDASSATAGGQGRAEAGRLRASTVGLLGRMRESLRDEMGSNPSLPADLDAQLFGYIDQLAATRRG